MYFGTKLFTSAAVLAVISFASSAYGQEYVNGPQLFANQYTQGVMDQATAQMYVAPVPTPEWVGHTYYTYQPLYPHEMMQHHHHRYHNYYDNGRGLNSTKIRYSPSILGMIHSKFPMIPRP